MTDFTKQIVVAASALMLAGAASAQSLKADIPFAFRVGNKLMQPGTYMVSQIGHNGIETYRLLNTEMREAALAMGNIPHDPSKEWRADGKPRLAFECGERHCTLSELWNGESTHPSYKFHIPKSRGESYHLAVVVAHRAKSE